MATISISEDTKKELDVFGRKGETYEIIIKRILEQNKGGKQK